MTASVRRILDAEPARQVAPDCLCCDHGAPDDECTCIVVFPSVSDPTDMAARLDDDAALLAACEAAEDALGCNLLWIADNTKATLNADKADTLTRYATLNEAWRGLVAAIAKARK